MVEAVASFRRGGVGIAGMSSSTLEEVQMQETLIFSDTMKVSSPKVQSSGIFCSSLFGFPSSSLPAKSFVIAQALITVKLNENMMKYCQIGFGVELIKGKKNKYCLAVSFSVRPYSISFLFFFSLTLGN